MTRRGCQNHAALSWRHRDHAARRGRWLVTLAAGTLVVLVLAGCGSPSSAQSQQTPTATKAATTPTATLPPTPTLTPGPTPVIIGDLGAFRQRVAGAITSGQWTRVQPLLSPSFSLQSPGIGAHMLMPDSANQLQKSVHNGNPWGQGSDYELSIHLCYAASTPVSQLIGFDGNDGHYLLIGIGHPLGQSYWTIAWAFEDPVGTAGYCIGNEG